MKSIFLSKTLREFAISYLQWDMEFVRELKKNLPQLIPTIPLDRFFNEAIDILKNPEEHPSISKEAKKYVVGFLQGDIHWFEKIFSFGMKHHTLITRIWTITSPNRAIKFSLRQLIEFLENYPERQQF